MSLALDIFSLVVIGAGAFFFFAGTVGLLRFPDSLTRLHALTKADNLGLGLIVLGLLPRAESLLDALRLIAIWALVQLSGAATAHVGRALSRRGAAGERARSSVWSRDPGLGSRRLTIAARRLFARSSAMSPTGFCSIVWIRLYAPTSRAEAAIGSSVTGVLLITSGARLRGAGGGETVEPPASRSVSWLCSRGAVPRRRPLSCCSEPAQTRATGAPGASPRPVSAIR
jgi:multicomponent Na+:H+ antiporter subunit G